MENKGPTITLEPYVLEAMENGLVEDEIVDFIVNQSPFEVSKEEAKDALDRVREIFLDDI